MEGGLRTFAIVAGGQFVSVLGSSLTAFALGIWVYQQTGSVTLLSLLILAASFPGVLISPIAGAVADRSDRRRVMLASDSTAGVATMIVAALIFTGRSELWHFFVLATISSLANAFQEPAYTAAIPLLVPKRHLGRASGFAQFSQGLARILTPLIAGAMIATAGLGSVLLVDVTTFLAAVGTLALVRFPRPLSTDAGARGKGSLLREAAAGWSYLRLRSGLIGLLLLFTAANFLVALVNVLYIPLVLSFSSSTTLGLVLTIGGTGMMAGSIGVMARGVPRRKIPAIMGLLFLGGIAIGVAGIGRSAVLIAASGFAMMGVLPVLQATSQTFWQIKVAPDLQGRVFALRRMLQQASLPAAYLAAGPLADRLFEPLMREGGGLAGSVGLLIGVGAGRGIGLLFVLAGISGCLLATVGYFHPRIRRLETDLPDMIADTPARGAEKRTDTMTVSAGQG
ncbi:MAG: MFS transporter [Pirellulales bacterium]|nr:MFS transporter [Pirellulales bacterium]